MVRHISKKDLKKRKFKTENHSLHIPFHISGEQWDLHMIQNILLKKKSQHGNHYGQKILNLASNSH